MSGIPTSSPFDRAARPALIVAVLTLVASGLGFRGAVRYLNVYLRKQPVALAQHLGSIPRTLGPWQAQGEDQSLDAAQIEALGTDKYLNRTYRLDGDGPTVNLHIAYYTGMIDAVPHIPDRCFVAGGWDPASAPTNYPLEMGFPTAGDDPEHRNLQTGEPYRVMKVRHPITKKREPVRLPIGDPEIRTITFTREDSPRTQLFGGYFFIANHRVTASPAVIRSLAFRPSEKYAYYCKVQVAAPLDVDTTNEAFLEMASDLLERSLPHLMRCLPDWTEIEARDPAGAKPAEPGANEG